MSILWRSWLTFSVVMATVLAILASLSILQHNAILSDLIRGRIAVVAHTTATAFRAITDLGLPLSTMRNGNEIVARARLTDPTISAVEVFEPAGNTVYTTADDRTAPIPAAVLRAQELAAGPAWNLETATDLDSGYSVLNPAGTVLGGVVVSYPKDDFNATADAMAFRMAWQALLLWLVFSALAFVILRILLAPALRGLARLEALPATLREQGAARGAPHPGGGRVLDGETSSLTSRLAAALSCFDAAQAALAPLAPGGGNDPPAPHTEPPPVMVEQSAATSLARVIAYRLVPWAALLMLISALILGLLALRDVNRSVEPELAARTALIGTVVSANVQRAVSAGIPLDDLVGAERYFGAFLSDLPEVAYIAVATGRIVLEAGQRIDPYLAPPRDRKDVLTHPIVYDEEEIGYVIIDIDPAFIAKQFLDVFLDQGVVVLVTVLLAFEVLVLTLSRSLTAPLDRLEHLANLQAAGDFSKRLLVGAGNTIDRIATLLSEHALVLHRSFARAIAHGAAPAGLRAVAERYHLSAAGPARLIFPYFTDIRLALFLFAAADELPISFLPLYTRAAANPWGWLDQGVVLSLPLAGYLVAIVIGSPFARTLSERFGHRTLVALAMAPTLLAHLGLYAATSVPEIVAWRTVTGFGYAIVTLACQDYLLDVLPRGQRDRSLGLYATVLFGGTFCGTAMGGVLADRLGQSQVFLVSTALIATSALLILWLVARIEQAERPAEPLPAMPAIWAPLANRRFSVLVLGIAIPANVVLQAFIAYLVALMLDSLGASVADIGRTLMLYFLMIALIGPLAARLAEGRVPVAYVALVGALLSGSILALPALWPGEFTILVAVVCCGIAHGMLRGPQVSLAMTIAETELAALGSTAVLGGLRTLERGGSVLGLLGIAFVSGTIGYPGAIAVMSLWVLGGAALFFLSMLADRARR